METLFDVICYMMESNGFHYDHFTGKVGEETVFFKNSNGKIKTAQFGFTPVKPKNYKIKFDDVRI